MASVFVYAIGFLAQGFFSARVLIQWVMSERSRKVLSPDIYWICSLAGSILLFSYGWLRDDFSIILGQVLTYYIYIWNLNVKGLWHRIPWLLRTVLVILPFGAFIYMARDVPVFISTFFHNSSVPLPLLIWGSAGQIIFTLRFIYQWYYSYRRGQSMLPLGFWVISLVGSGIIVSYGIFRLDPVLILGQSVGFIAYIRNIILNNRNKK